MPSSPERPLVRWEGESDADVFWLDSPRGDVRVGIFSDGCVTVSGRRLTPEEFDQIVVEREELLRDAF